MIRSPRYLAVNVTIPNVMHKVRMVILWKYQNDTEPRKMLVSNSIFWNAEKIVEIYRKRWTSTEPFHLTKIASLC
ncbi:MAG: hypothetical protein LBJ67_08960 [Planctomycetaceae bacterium]|nr:hypothetical protein [Planctomycetaceae bacterium]